MLTSEWQGEDFLSSLVFVHGIGVRAPEGGGEHPFEETCRAVRFELALKGINWRLIPCGWGDDLGARLLAGGKSFPTGKSQLGVVIVPQDQAGLWELLLNDPSFEVRALAAMMAELPTAALTGPPGQRPAWIILHEQVMGSLRPSGRLAVRLNALAIEAPFEQAVKETQADPATRNALQHPQAARAIARAIAARTVRIALARGIPPPGLTDLETLADDIAQLLRGAELSGLRDWAKSAFIGWGTRLGTSWGEGQRAMLANVATPIAGDVIYYQAHGDLIRDRIRKAVADAPEPVAILAHSLGGVASLEALCEDGSMRKRVKKFITAGSQSGFFYELNALRTHSFDCPLPDDFPDWLNFWDMRDFLSFLTKDVFAGGGSRTDIEIKSGLPFPASHSGYWRQSATWEKLRTFLAD